jgi:hypothetical protein
MKTILLAAQVSILAGIVLGTSAGAATKTITLPADGMRLEPSELPGYLKAQSSCMTCHSAEYIRYQPSTAPRTYWEAMVKRMKAIFNAPIEDADMLDIVDYLVRTYGAERTPESISKQAVNLAAATASSAHVPFVAVQPEQFSSPGALSNAWADFDGDGDLDLLVTFKSGEVRLYRNDGGTFASVGAALGLPVRGDEARAAAWGDYDGDGDVDLYVGSSVSPIPTRNRLYRNDGGRGFVEIAQTLGVDVPGANTRQVSWIDYDRDGDLDLFVAQRAGANRLFRNDGQRFTDVSRTVGLADGRRTVGACWFDMDQDGDLDVYVANQAGDKDGFYRNDGEHFTDIARQLGMEQSQRTIEEGGVGCGVADFDNDGDFDLFVATYGAPLLYRNDGKGRFTEVAQSVGIVANEHFVVAAWGDYDNDGRIDLYVSGYRSANLRQKDFLYRNEGSRFVDVLPREIAANDADHGVQWADYDFDGDLDLVLANSDDERGGEPLFRNDSSKEPRSRSLKVLVLDAEGNYTRAGSEVRVYTPDGALLGSRLVDAGGGYDSQNAAPVHFGLPRVVPVTVEVTFLTQQGRLVERIVDVDPRKLNGKPLVVGSAGRGGD